MLKTKSLNLAKTLAEKNIINIDDIEIVAHGITVGMRLCINTLLTLLLGVTLDMAFESIFFIIMFSAVRSYAGGFHFKNPGYCYIMSSAVIVLALVIVKSVLMHNIVLLSILLILISMTIILCFAPIGTESKPLDNDETIVFRKKTIRNSIIEIVFAMVLFVLELKMYSFIIVLAITLSASLVIIQLIYVKVTGNV